MESPSCSTLTAGPLSLAAQTVMAALRAQYAGRIHRTRHSEPHLGSSSLMERAVESTQTIPTESSDYIKPPWRLLHEEKGRRFYNHSPEMELPSQPAISLFQSKDNTFSEWETDEPGSLKLRDYGLDGSLLALNDNKITVSGNHILKIHTQSEEPFPMKDFSDWEDPQAVPDAIVVPEKQREISRTKKNIRLMCLSEDVFKAERVTRAPPRKRWSFSHLQMPAMSCSKDFIEEQKSDFGRQNREGSSKKMEADCFEGKMETVEGVMTMPKQRKDQEVGMSEKIQLNGLWSEGPDKESVVCGNGQKGNKLQPLLCHSHLKDIAESSKRELLKSSLDLADSSNFDDNTNELFRPSENNLQEPIQKVFYIPSFPLTSTKARGFDQGRMVRDDGSMYTVKEMEESGPGEWDSTCNKTDLFTPRPGERNVQMEAEVSIEQEDSADSMVPDTHTSHQELSQENGNNGRRLIPGVFTSGPRDLPPWKVDKRSPGVETKTVVAPKKPGKWKPPKPTQGGPKITLSQETCPKHGTSMPAFSSPFQQSSIPTGTKVKLLHQTQQSKSTELLNPHKGALALNERPEQNSTLQKKQKKQDTKTTNHSYISEFPKQKRSASEIDNQIHPEHPEGVKERYAISASSRLTLALPSDARVCDTSRLSQEERVCVLEEASRARALVVSMVYQDGTTQLDPEQKPLPAVCGLLVLLKKSLESLDLDQTGAAKERVLLLRLEQRPVWVQQDSQHNQDLFTREILLQMVCGMQSLVCYKSKDLLRTILRHFSRDLSWKQVAACQVLDPQIAAWLLDPADSAHCFQDLLSKHCSLPATHTPAQPALGHSKVTQAISNLSHLHRLMVELQNKLQTHGLWQLYFCMEQKMIPVLAAMESHSIHVDKENLKKTSDMLGNKLKQLEQEAHQAAGQQFLVSSSAQLRLVLFEKLRLHERCENKKLPKTVFKQQQSTSEAALLQLQDLHPLPKIILEHRQLHKIKSTFVDGILSFVMKSFISSTWNQTSTVSGRLSAKHPNFQALPKLPVQITKKQYIQGKEEEFVTVHPRSMFIPQEGWTFLSADFCQVELRLLAHLSSDPELLRIFQNPEADVFTMLASQWKGINEDSVSSEDRDHAKRIVYSVVYGAGKKRLSGILRVSLEEASHFQDSFLQTYKEVQNFIQHTVQHCHKYGYVKSIMGRRRFLPHVHSTDWGVRNQAERQAVNFVVQGSAADLCKMAMIQICSHVSSSTTFTARLVAQIHDELLFEVEDSQVEDFAVLVKEIMESLEHIDCLGVSLNVPLKVSVSTGRSWGSMCELSLPHAAAHTSP
ncbi:DNA polymerase nu [Pygocentrus nattereri]|uniref:DNA polymerase nu n=1 Tax=Pygocentrus nattereri TaxID=42514 RepID=UPI001891DB7D|nr:DNA polymerase nu [Pygocentrus nattereri]